jgi:PAS domain S-box-containing protein
MAKMSSSGSGDGNGDATGGTTSTEQSPPAELELLEAIPDPVVVIDPVDGDVLYVNDPCTALFGAARDDLLDRPTRAFFGVDPEFIEGTNESVARDIAAAVDGMEHEVEAADGRVVVAVGAREASVGGRDVVVGRLEDRTRQRRMADTIEETEQHLAAITSHLPAILFTLEADGTVSYIEGSGLSRLDIDPATLHGENCFTLFEEYGIPAEPLEEAFAGETVETIIEFGETPFQSWYRPVREHRGEVSHVVGIALDLTVQRRRRQLLGILNRVLRHNLRNELNIVLGAAADIRNSPETSEMAAQRAATVTESAERLVRLSEKARPLAAIDWDRDQAPTYELSAVLQSSFETVTARFPEADIEVEAPPEPVTIAGVGMEFALTELLDNAIRHNPAGGPRAVVTTSVSTMPGRGARVTVVDDGPGLSEMEREVLDQGRETPLEHSEGLGLWLVHCVAMTAGGVLEVDADSDGTAITIELPQSSDG